MIVAVIAMGMMGSAVGARLVARGATVRTSLQGRTGASAERAHRAGVEICSDEDLLRDADLVLSIVPPGVAVELAERLAPHLSALAAKPAFVDCNAVAPATLERVAAIVASAGAPFADAGIFGTPPVEGRDGPRFYVCGEGAQRALGLAAYGIDIVGLDGPAGTASAVKMCYGALTKGLTALGAAVTIGAENAGVADVLRAEMLRSQPEMRAWLDRQLPGMSSKAYRWVAEMNEVGQFLGGDENGSAIYRAVAEFYEDVAAAENATAR